MTERAQCGSVSISHHKQTIKRTNNGIPLPTRTDNERVLGGQREAVGEGLRVERRYVLDMLQVHQRKH